MFKGGSNSTSVGISGTGIRTENITDDPFPDLPKGEHLEIDVQGAIFAYLFYLIDTRLPSSICGQTLSYIEYAIQSRWRLQALVLDIYSIPFRYHITSSTSEVEPAAIQNHLKWHAGGHLHIQPSRR
ncbi:hypothetical protein EVAR_44588_1 [Eumeta japonica]|uniref:Uncharacterized protein n=1 Tax=Eumeta variegata TaxID=151549 RepID=A0A4C1XAG1_EUMVA|nr:hypothetical protein EVAR_44588_1 [Eumeta japonica]